MKEIEEKLNNEIQDISKYKFISKEEMISYFEYSRFVDMK